jgi:hypothetical protein
MLEALSSWRGPVRGNSLPSERKDRIDREPESLCFLRERLQIKVNLSFFFERRQKLGESGLTAEKNKNA